MPREDAALDGTLVRYGHVHQLESILLDMLAGGPQEGIQRWFWTVTQSCEPEMEETPRTEL